GDVDRDGVVDVLDVSFQSVQFRKGFGDGTFAAPVPAFSGDGDSVTLADVNGDRVPDLLRFSVFPQMRNNLFVALGNGDGTFTQFSSRSLGFHLRDVAVADFNGDGANAL